jgi:hypothetical protein
MNRIRYLACLLGGLALSVLALGSSPAFAQNVPAPGRGDVPPVDSPPTHVLAVGGMPGWQITLIAVGAALLAAVLAVIADRMWATRRRVTTRAA